MLDKALQKEFDNGLPEPLYFLWGEESFFLEEVLSRAIKTVIASYPVEFNYDSFDPSTEPQKIIDASSTLPFMAPRRLIVLKDFHQFPASTIKALTTYFKNPSRTTCMMILSMKPPKMSPDMNMKVYSLNMREKAIPGWLKQVAIQKGIRITDEAMECLIESVGHNIGLLVMEIEKLALLKGRTVDDKDVLSSISAIREYRTFELIDALVAGQKKRSFKILKMLISTMDATAILGTLNWHYRQLYSLWLNKGKRPSKMKERTYRMLIRHLPSLEEENFHYIFKSLHEADIGIKTSGRPELVLEALLIRLLQKGSVN